MMNRDDYLGTVESNTRTVGDAAAAHPDAAVPSCPDWQLRDLAFHVGSVLAMWEGIVREASTEPPRLGDGLARPADDELREFVGAHTAALLDTLTAAPEDTPAWNWWGDPTARQIPRRVAHEMAVHAWDAANALGGQSQIDPTLAADGIFEYFETIVPRTRRPPEFEATIRLEAVDLGAVWTADASPDGPPVLCSDDRAADVTLRGTASELLLVLWRRLPVGTISISGNHQLAEQFLAYPRL